MKSPDDPVDHARTTRPHAGETMKDTTNMPAIIVLGIALVMFVSALAAHATSNHTVGIVLGCISAVAFAIAGVWFKLAHRRVRNIEERWHAEHPDTDMQQPSS
ncbi:LapA family protein [Mycolicibacterium sp. S2-37]|uniref:protein UsfY n=1 Tax=Mycolicibacterium sp. S2-37 TaxID=2810297 RepID=UPI001A94BA94|nr:protein UsfY [Mycolicibacterium sp. S2-37]MBO0677741.1 LapA family protein [Mycolicibacterium sp. S2-37]